MGLRRYGWILFSVLLGSCGGSQNEVTSPTRTVEADRPLGEPISIPAPLGLPPVPVPANNPPTAETVAFGKKLYFSPLLSVDRTLSCASCHDPKLGFADG